MRRKKYECEEGDVCNNLEVEKGTLNDLKPPFCEFLLSSLPMTQYSIAKSRNANLLAFRGIRYKPSDQPAHYTKSWSLERRLSKASNYIVRRRAVAKINEPS